MSKRKKVRKSSAKSRFNVSQAQHKRLMIKARSSKDEMDQFIKGNYHSSCFEKQKKLGRILTQKEKEAEYESARWFYFN